MDPPELRRRGRITDAHSLAPAHARIAGLYGTRTSQDMLTGCSPSRRQGNSRHAGTRSRTGCRLAMARLKTRRGNAWVSHAASRLRRRRRFGRLHRPSTHVVSISRTHEIAPRRISRKQVEARSRRIREVRPRAVGKGQTVRSTIDHQAFLPSAKARTVHLLRGESRTRWWTR